MAEGRVAHTATLLQSGKVLVTGGLTSGGAPAGTELYDPQTDTWSAATNPGHPRLFHTATLLPSGQVLVAGGFDTSRTPEQQAELYDPATNSWSSAGTMAAGHANHTATLLPSGKVLVAGGSDATNWLDTAEVYDPGTNSWSAVARMAARRASHTATLLATGQVLVAGGSNGAGLASAELYDPIGNTWTAAASMGAVRAGHTATLLPSGEVLVAGGAQASAERYSPAAGAWTSVGSMSAARTAHTAILLPTGQVLVAGGQDDSTPSVTLDSADLFDPAAGAWSAAGDMGNAGNVTQASLLPTGKVLAITDQTNFVRVYTPSGNGWSVAASLSTRRSLPTLTLLPSGRLLVAGGRGLSSAEYYDEDNDTWTATGPMNAVHESGAAVLLPTGEALVIGGLGAIGNSGNAVERYDTATNTWAQRAPMLTIRHDFTATLLHDGRVLVAGGFATNNRTANAELYDPSSNTWTATGALAHARSGHTATLLPSGKVLVAGGVSGAGGSSASVLEAELYDPATGLWSPAGTLPPGTGGISPGATLLPSGQVLLTGGFDPISAAHASSQLYDPVANAWTSAPPLTTARGLHASVLLPMGHVLAVGGLDNTGAGVPLSSAERYDPGLAPVAVRQPRLLAPYSFLLPGGMGTLGASSSGSMGDGNGAVTRTGFRPPIEANGSMSGSNSASNAPVLQVQRIDNGQMRFITPDASQPPVDVAFTASAAAMSGFPDGPVLVRAWVNGVPSSAPITRLALASPSVLVGLVANPVSPTTAGASVTFTAMLTGGNSPMGAVTFKDGGTTLCTVSAAPYTCAATLAAGNHPITAEYAGDINNDSAIASLQHVVNKAQPVLTLGTTPMPSIWGQSIDILSTLNGGYVPTGAITFYDNGTLLCTVAAAPYLCTTAALAAGTHAITASYAGDANNKSATLALNHTVSPAAQAITHFAATPTVPVYVQGGSFTVSATGGASGNPVRFSSLDTSVCTVNGNMVTMVVVGICLIAADQEGNTNYSAAPRLVSSVTMAPAGPVAPTPVPMLGAWALALLVGLLGWLGVHPHGRSMQWVKGRD
ncbi:hypothetical protein GCM10027082_47750 [Comamonas humi]